MASTNKALETSSKTHIKPTNILAEPLPKEVQAIPPLHGRLPTLRSLDYNIQYFTLFFDLKAKSYTKTIQLDDGMKVVQYKKWTRNLRQSGIMTLLDVQDFECSVSANCYIKFLLSRFHNGILWLDRSYLMTEHLMGQITGLLHIGEDPTEILKAKDANVQEIYAKYGIRRGNRGATIGLINDQGVRFATQILACKLLRKCKKDECLVGVILAAEHCMEGV